MVATNTETGTPGARESTMPPTAATSAKTTVVAIAAAGAATTRAAVFNVCTGRGTTVRSLAETMALLCRTDLVVQRQPARPGDVRISIGDPRRAAAQLPFEAKTALSNGLAQTISELERCRQEVTARAGETARRHPRATGP